MAVHVLSEERRARIEHVLDTSSVAVGVWLYRRTHGRITSLWRRRAIVLTTTGRRSGRDRTVLVQAFEDGGRVYVVAANSGTGRRPGWFHNLRAHPQLIGELYGRRLELRAELLAADEADDTWRWILTIAPDYERYERRLGRIPPILRLVADEDQ